MDAQMFLARVRAIIEEVFTDLLIEERKTVEIEKTASLNKGWSYVFGVSDDPYAPDASS